MYTYRAKMLRVIDGDTVELEIDLGFHIKVVKRVRFSYIDAPPVKTPEGQLAKNFVSEHVPPGSDVLIKTQLDKNDKYGRVLGEIYRPEDARSINTMLLENKLAVDYK